VFWSLFLPVGKCASIDSIQNTKPSKFESRYSLSPSSFSSFSFSSSLLLSLLSLSSLSSSLLLLSFLHFALQLSLIVRLCCHTRPVLYSLLVHRGDQIERCVECGLHCHVLRATFGPGTQKRKEKGEREEESFLFFYLNLKFNFNDMLVVCYKISDCSTRVPHLA
jgi:hypothetical protein